jgi:hypothetical protein
VLRSFSNLRSDFHGGNTGSNPVGDANKINGFRTITVFAAGTKRHNFITNCLALFAQSLVFSGIRSRSSGTKGHTIQPRYWNRNSGSAKQANDPTLSSSFMNCDGLSVCVQCDSAGSMTKQFLHYLDICFCCP